MSAAVQTFVVLSGENDIERDVADAAAPMFLGTPVDLTHDRRRHYRFDCERHAHRFRAAFIAFVNASGIAAPTLSVEPAE